MLLIIITVCSCIAAYTVYCITLEEPRLYNVCWEFEAKEQYNEKQFNLIK
jgi:hypothetical protein